MFSRSDIKVGKVGIITMDKKTFVHGVVDAHLPAGLEPEDLKRCGHHHALLLVVGGRDALEALQTLHGRLPALGLVGNHAWITEISK